MERVLNPGVAGELNRPTGRWAHVSELLAIQPEEEVDRPGRQSLQPVGQPSLPEGQGYGEGGVAGRGVQRPLAPGGYGPGPERRGAELPELMTAGRWDSPTMPAK